MSARSTSRVVPGADDTIASSDPTSTFSNDDFPAFGRPHRVTRTPLRTSCALSKPESSRSISPRIPVSSGVASSRSSASSSTSSAKSRSVSACARLRISVDRHFQHLSTSSPFTPRMACLRCSSVSAFRRSPSASTSTNDIFPFRKARFVNSPGFADRNRGIRDSDLRVAATTAGLPCRWNSTTFSSV